MKASGLTFAKKLIFIKDLTVEDSAPCLYLLAFFSKQTLIVKTSPGARKI